MNLRMFAAALVVAMAGSAASAATYDCSGPQAVDNGDTVNVDTSCFFFDTFEAGDSVTSWELFVNTSGDATGTGAVSLASIGEQSLLSLFTGLTMTWYDGNGGSSSVQILSDDVSLDTTFSDPLTLNQRLVVSWTSAEDGAGFDVIGTVTVVPLPAGALLLGTALAGLGFARRRKAA